MNRLIILALTLVLFACDEENDNNDPIDQNENPYFSTDSLELPKYNNSSIRQYTEFKLQYIETYELAAWVAYVLTPEKLVKNFDRTDNFRPDPIIESSTADDDDFSGSGYDRGHLMPAADCTWDETTMSESFFYSNIAPQAPGLNRGEWSQLEEDFRELAIKYDSVWIVTGPVLIDDHVSGSEPFDRIGPNEVAVPRRYFKAGLFRVDGEFKAVGFILPNEPIDNEIPMTDFQMTIDELEMQLDMDLYHLLPDDIELPVESATFNIYD